MPLPALVLAVAALIGRGTPSPKVVSAIAEGCEAEAAAHPVDAQACAALVTTYAALESGFQDNPRAVSWDAKAIVSCGILQVPCRRSLDPEHDVRMWLWMLRRSSLARVDSSPSRAARRVALAERLLARVTPTAPR